jgi:hypothetical protein
MVSDDLLGLRERWISQSDAAVQWLDDLKSRVNAQC